MSSADETPRVIDVALTVADGSAVDWSARRAETPEDTPLLDGLREIAQVAEQHGIEIAAPAVPDDAGAWGRLRLLRRLGRGSFGEVWAAWDPVLEREVALKLRREDAGDGSSRRWLNEGRRLARVHHPNVLAVFGADVHDGRAGIWTELLDGATLESWIEAHGPMGAREAALVGLDLCAALAAVHGAGLVHGDLKLANVIRVGAASGDPRASGRIVLMDFGSAADTGGAAGAGTPLALAPEVLAGQPSTPASDLYSLGVALFRLVTAKWPVEAASLEGMRQRHARGERVALRNARPDLPRPFVAAVERALEGDPASRFASAAQMESALAPVVAVSAPRRRSLPLPTGIAVAVASLGVIGAAMWWARAGHGPVSVRPSGSPLAASRPPATAPPARSIAAPPPSAASLDLSATLERVGERGAESMHDGDRIAPGDRLFLELQAAVPVHAYVLDEDDSGHVFVLFPIAGRGLRNPIAPGVARRLPGREGADELDWEVTSAGGRETFLIVASSDPVRAVEDVVRRSHAADPGAAVEYPQMDPTILGTLRGVGGLSRRPRTSPEPSGRLQALDRELRESPRNSVWTRLVVLQNPDLR